MPNATKNINHPRLKDIIRFCSRVRLADSLSCWEWVGSFTDKGYGQFSYRSYSFLAHRFAYYLHFNEDPKGLFVCHRCDNPKCVNPNHLFLGTCKDNHLDMIAKGRKGYGGKPGEKHLLSKIKDCDVPAIRKLREEGLTYDEIGRRFGVTAGPVWRVINGQSRSYIK